MLLALDSARTHGLVTGGPVIDADRCQQLLDRGAALGFRPAPDSVERLLPLVQRFR